MKFFSTNAAVGVIGVPTVPKIPCSTGSMLSLGFTGVTAVDAADAGPVPFALVAVTVKVYIVPFVRPVTLHVSAPVVEHDAPPGLAVTVYAVIALPPSDAGASHDTVASALPATAVTDCGDSGAERMVYRMMTTPDPPSPPLRASEVLPFFMPPPPPPPVFAVPAVGGPTGIPG